MAISKIKTWVHFGWMNDYSRSLNWCRILKFEKLSDPDPVSREISDLILFFSYFASQSKGIQSGNFVFDVCCVNYNIFVRCQVLTTSHSAGITLTLEHFRT